ncbi:MAG TPA: NADH:flavin oxidoreductase [Desulfobacterales bacterium]|nr:NADH:flavin oxidoreductase [Desulfobacterales bacterium]
MSKLFEATEINGMKLANRFVRSATWEGMAADDGAVTSNLNDCMAKLAEGGVGLIISSHAYVHPRGQAGPWQLGVYKDELIPGLKTMTEAVHEKSGKIVLQLAHAGFFANAKLTGETSLAPSNVEGIAKGPRQELTVVEIKEIVAALARSAERAKEAGFDGVQIHSAHAYLLSQFLSPAFNKRTDEYGGDICSRAKIHMEVLQAIRDAVGADYPVLIKMNSQDFIDGGLSLEDSVQVGKMMAEGGIDAIEISGGMLNNPKLSPSRVGINKKEKEAYFQEAAKAFRAKIDVPLILVGGNRSFEVAERLVDEGVTDYISLSRPFIREPGLINRWKSGDLQKAACISDNQCFEPAMKGKGIYCVTEEIEKQHAKEK